MLTLCLFWNPDVRSITLDSSAFKALLSIAVVAVAALIALILAKVASYLYDRKIERRKERQPVDAEAADLVRARLAVMQFKRHRMGQAELTPEEETMRKTIGIWSYKGGKTLGPLKPPKKKPEPTADKTVSGMATKHLNKDAKRERKVAEKADVESSTPISSSRGAAPLSPRSNTESNQPDCTSSPSYAANSTGDGSKVDTKSTKPIDQVQLVSKVNQNVPTKPLPGMAIKLNHGNHNKVEPSGAQGSSKEEPPTHRNSRELDSQSSSHGTSDSARRSPSTPGSPGKGPASSRRLFTIVTPSVERKKDLKRQESSVSARAAAKRTNDTHSMKSEPGVRENDQDGSAAGQAPPVKRPTTSHLSSRTAPAEKNQSSVGVAILGSKQGKQTANGKTLIPKVKVKPNTGVGVANDDSSKQEVAVAGSKR
ncbi:hypothetical protein ElyMa_002555500 [Elysia marginata]|uniref:Uncharacterized protein n=1 Tax=Elysia marginata TaxID=1093978 RepID=A0AAV4GWZ6_9GAST|nr:hypothetical protein ElyMa_002555500 [Elysia marginata]